MAGVAFEFMSSYIKFIITQIWSHIFLNFTLLNYLKKFFSFYRGFSTGKCIKIVLFNFKLFLKKGGKNIFILEYLETINIQLFFNILSLFFMWISCLSICVKCVLKFSTFIFYELKFNRELFLILLRNFISRCKLRIILKNFKSIGLLKVDTTI